MKWHKTNDRRKIKISNLDTRHLINAIMYIKRKAKEGLVIRIGGGHDSDDMWYEEYALYGKKAKKYMNYKIYKRELKRRKVKNPGAQ